METELVDRNDGLKRLGGNAKLYNQLIERFLSSNYIQAIENALQSGDLEDAKHQTHALKGVSANLSLNKIRTASIELEKSFDGGGDQTACFEELKLAYGETEGYILTNIIGQGS